MQTVAVVFSFVINMFTTLFLVYAHYTFHCLFSFFLFTRRSFSVSIAYNDHDILVVSNPVRGSVSMFDSALFSVHGKCSHRVLLSLVSVFMLLVHIEYTRCGLFTSLSLDRVWFEM